tara:strand:- start:333 stop:572 length:240 start_codon:yes stop_codon:yes gene_type:complete
MEADEATLTYLHKANMLFKIYQYNDFEKEGRNVKKVSRKLYKLIRKEKNEYLYDLSLNNIRDIVKETFDCWNEADKRKE